MFLIKLFCVVCVCVCAVRACACERAHVARGSREMKKTKQKKDGQLTLITDKYCTVEMQQYDIHEGKRYTS